MISIKQLSYALAVEKTLHFKQAAEVSNISPSALSTALHELEKQLGLQIFERDNKKVLIKKNIQVKIMGRIESIREDSAKILKDWGWAYPTYEFEVAKSIKSVAIDTSKLMADIKMLE